MAAPFQFLLVAVALTGLAAIGAPAPADSPKSSRSTNEPPLVLFLETGGKKIPVEIDRPFPVEAVKDGTPAVLRIAEHREFRFGGLTFRYPRDFTYEVETGDEGLLTWTLSGRDTTVIVNWFPGETDHASVRRQVLKEFQEAVKGEGKEGHTKRSKATLEWSHGRLDGERLQFDTMGVDMEQSSFSFRGEEGAFVLLIQDSADDQGLPSTERRRLSGWFKESLELPKPGPAPSTPKPGKKPAPGSRADERTNVSSRG